MCLDADIVVIMFPPGEDKGFRSLLGSSDPTVWHQALEALPPLRAPAPDASAAAGTQSEPDLDRIETLRQAGERLVEVEASVFDREFQKRNAADFR